MTKVQILTSDTCAHCVRVKAALKKIKEDMPNLEIEEVNLLKPEGQKMAAKYGVMASPGIIIDGKLAFQGGATEEQLRGALK